VTTSYCIDPACISRRRFGQSCAGDTAGPLAAQVAFACVLTALFAYWAHLWMHAVPLLWCFHAIHHSPAHVYWLNAARSHPGEHVFRGFLSGIPLAVAGAPAEVLAYVMVISRMAGLFQHHSAKKIEVDPI
jgi:sterol desaturase/sphingolipid hydroxylase (fatty acid hydroxylase superfamily)